MNAPSRGFPIGLLLFISLAVAVFSAGFVWSIPHFYSEVGIILLFGVTAFRYGVMSIPMVMMLAAYIPALAFFWAGLHGAEYINPQDHSLQDNIAYVDRAVHIAFSSMLVAVALLATILPTTKTRLDKDTVNRISPLLYLISTFGFAFFFWLTEPGATIFTVSRNELIDQRYQDTQFAGAVGVLFWLISFVTFASESGTRKSYKFANTVFVWLSVIAMGWLLLHGRRSELTGMVALLCIFMAEKKGIRFALAFAAVGVGLLILVENIRAVPILEWMAGAELPLGRRENVASLPGGASNIFMTLIDAIDYFSHNALYMGDTFTNYLFQALPTPIYLSLGIDRPPYFYQTVFHDYEWNGGTYILAVFYGNFGYSGALLGGLFIGLITAWSGKAASSQELGIRLIGLLIVVFCFRAMWYELITWMKPLMALALLYLVLLGVGGRRTNSQAVPARN
jgi:hypothetical protein